MGKEKEIVFNVKPVFDEKEYKEVKRFFDKRMKLNKKKYLVAEIIKLGIKEYEKREELLDETR